MEKQNKLISPFIWDECPQCGYALIINSSLRHKGIRECARCDFIGKLEKTLQLKVSLNG